MKLKCKLKLFRNIFILSSVFFTNQPIDTFNLDLMSVKTNHGGPLDRLFLEKLKELFNAKIFIESGTYYGDSAAIAAEIFEEVHTIELSDFLFKKACERFANRENIKIYHGDSAQMISRILLPIQKRILFWLDGHWSCGATARGSVNTPIKEELLAIKESGLKNSIILIDDIRLFQKSEKDVHDTPFEGYPDLSNVIDLIHSMNNDYRCYVLGDILIAFTDKNIHVSPLIEALTISRIDKDSDLILGKAETKIINSSEEEMKVLRNLSECFRNDTFAFNRYYQFWYGLALIHRNKKFAYNQMIKALNSGYDRARQYISK